MTKKKPIRRRCWMCQKPIELHGVPFCSTECRHRFWPHLAPKETQ